MKPSLVLAALALVAATVTTAASAREIPAACQQDAASLCPGLTPGDGKFGKCMKSHETQVSKGCREAARAMRKNHEERHDAHPGVTPMPASPRATTTQ